MLEYLLSYFYDIKVIIILVVIYLIYKLEKLSQNLDEKIGHKGPPPLPFFGNLLDVRKTGFHEFDKYCLQKYGKLYPFYFGGIKTIVVSDEELLKQILIKEFKCFTDRMDIRIVSKRSATMLSVLKGKEWERIRNLVTPIFTSGKLRKMSPLISGGIDLLRKQISQHPINQPIDFKEYFGALTMDVIAQTMFGMNIDSQTNPNNIFVKNAKKLFSFSFLKSLSFLFLIFPKFGRFIRKIIPNREFFGGGTFEFFMDSMEEIIEKRSKSTEKFNDFLGIMLRAQKDNAGNSKSLTDEEILAQSLMFLLAGYETTATTLTYVAYFLAKNPSAQTDLYNEILNTIGNEGEITYEVLMDMPILDAIVCETLRICPPAVRFDRVCTQDVTLVGSDNRQILAKKGDVFTVPIYAIHTDPSIWEDPDKFDYHRFDPEHKKRNGPFSYIPFGIGQRNCIGMRFALLEIKWAIVNVLQKFQINACDETMETMKFKVANVLSPIHPIIVKIVQRI